MMRKCGPVEVCKPEERPATKRKCKPFSVCSGNYTIRSDGDCVWVEKRSFTIPDGTYSALTFEDGCIVGVGDAPVPTYTPNECCPPAGGGGGGGEIEVPIAPTAGNLTHDTSAGIETLLYVATTDTVAVTGTGVVNDPIRLTFVGGGEASIVAASSDPVIIVEGSGTTTDPLMIGMDATRVEAGGAYGLEWDSHGLITNFSSAGQSLVSSIIADPPLSALPETGLPGVWRIGLIPGAEPGTYSTQKYDFIVGEGGVIVSVTPRTPITTPGSFYAPAGGGQGAKIISYDEWGQIIGVQNA